MAWSTNVTALCVQITHGGHIAANVSCGGLCCYKTVLSSPANTLIPRLSVCPHICLFGRPGAAASATEHSVSFIYSFTPSWSVNYHLFLTRVTGLLESLPLSSLIRDPCFNLSCRCYFYLILVKSQVHIMGHLFIIVAFNH